MNRTQLKVKILLVVMMIGIMNGCSAAKSSVVSEEDKSAPIQDSYNQGYTDGFTDCEKKQTVNVKVSGDFTATVRALIPDYVYDSETPRAAVVTLFQDGPFVLRLDEQMCKELKEGETYTFIVGEQDATLIAGQYWDDGNVSSDALILGCFSVTDFRVPSEDEYGLECWRVNYIS